MFKIGQKVIFTDKCMPWLYFGPHSTIHSGVVFSTKTKAEQRKYGINYIIRTQLYTGRGELQEFAYCTKDMIRLAEPSAFRVARKKFATVEEAEVYATQLAKRRKAPVEINAIF